jgi:hypothetical protein
MVWGKLRISCQSAAGLIPKANCKINKIIATVIAVEKPILSILNNALNTNHATNMAAKSKRIFIEVFKLEFFFSD